MFCRTTLLSVSSRNWRATSTRTLSAGVLSHYNPVYVRIFNNPEQYQSNTRLTALHYHTSHLVNAWEKYAHKNTKWRNYLSDHDKSKLKITLGKCMEALQSITNTADLEVILSMITILSPNSEKTWIEIDHLVLDWLRDCSVDTAILVACALINSTKLLKFKDMSFIAPQIVGEKLVQQKWTPTSDDMVTNIERLGLTLQLLAHTMPSSSVPPTAVEFEFLSDFVSSAIALLSSANAEVPFTTWKYIWLFAPKIDLPDAREFYRLLYERVLQSVTLNPLQLLYQEDAIVSLFDSMIISKMKHGELLHKVSEELLYRGMDYPRVGLKMFSALLELGAVPLASTVLNNLMKVPTEQLELNLHEGIKGGSFRLTNTASDRVYHLLKNNHAATPKTKIKAVSLSAFEATQMARKQSAPREYRSADLILALLCFNRKDKHSDHMHLLESIEVDLLSKQTLVTLPVADLVNILHVYAMLGRVYPSMLRQLDTALASQVVHCTVNQWSTILWSCARLNHCPSYVDQLITDYFKLMENHRVLTHSDMHVLCKSLWSMAVLGKIEWRHVQQMQPLLTQYVRKNDRGWEMDPNACVQLAQVQTELNSKPAENDVRPDDIKQLNSFLETIAVKDRVRRKLKSAAISSYTHNEASRMLKELGISHEIEKMLSYGYIVDIFIPPSKNNDRGSAEKPFLGTVVELNGPYHYDTFLRMPLGPGIMKARHLTSLGYEVISLPYWEYKAAMTTNQKKNALIRASKNI